MFVLKATYEAAVDNNRRLQESISCLMDEVEELKKALADHADLAKRMDAILGGRKSNFLRADEMKKLQRFVAQIASEADGEEG